MSQLVYNDIMALGVGGDPVDASGSPKSKRTYNVVTGGEILPGLAVAKIPGDADGARLPNSAADAIIGVAHRDLQLEDDPVATDVYFPANYPMPVMFRGSILVRLDQNVTPDSNVFIRFSGEVEVFTITWDGDFIASNNIDGSINGVAISQVTFTTDQATTIGLVAASIQALDTVATASVTGAREITVTGATEGLDISSNATFDVTGGASQANDVIANVTGPSTGTQQGIFRADDDDVGNGANAVALTTARFLGNGSAGGVVELDLNIP